MSMSSSGINQSMESFDIVRTSSGHRDVSILFVLASSFVACAAAAAVVDVVVDVEVVQRPGMSSKKYGSDYAEKAMELRLLIKSS